CGGAGIVGPLSNLKSLIWYAGLRIPYVGGLSGTELPEHILSQILEHPSAIRGHNQANLPPSLVSGLPKIKCYQAPYKSTALLSQPYQSWGGLRQLLSVPEVSPQ
ncbi:hypothetical protein Tco_1473803, partial [Tanacetum coccineum]